MEFTEFGNKTVKPYTIVWGAICAGGLLLKNKEFEICRGGE